MADNSSLKKCGFCGENIPLGAGRCPYCGSILEVTIEDSYQIDPNAHLNNNVSEQNTAGYPDIDGQPHADVQQETTSNYGESGDYDAAPQGTESPQLQETQPQPYQPQGPGLQPQQQSQGSDSHPQPQIQPYRPVQGDGRSPYQSSYQTRPVNDRPALGNGLKVFLTILFTVIPGIGQIAGIITAIVFMSSTDQDRKSFGVAILVASLIMFVLSCLGCFIFSIAASNFPSMY